MAEQWKNTRRTLSKFEELLQCSRCSQLLNNPYVLENCRHSFCKTCIADGEICPRCNIPLEAREINPDRTLSDVMSLTSRLRDLLEKTKINEAVNKTTPSKPVSSKAKSPRTNASAKVSRPISSSHKAQRCERSKLSTSPTSRLHREKNEGASPVQRHSSCSPPPERKSKLASSPPSHLHRGKNEDASPVRSNSSCSPKVERKLSQAHLKVQNSSSPIGFSSGCDKRNMKGETPLHVACIIGDVAKVKYLLEDGANPNVKDNAGWTPLHEASNKNFLDIVVLLVKFGALINTPGYDNDTPLHDAVQTNSVKVAEFLVRNGADINVRNARGLTPVDLAKTKEISDALESTVSLSFSKTNSNSAPASLRTVIQTPQQVAVLCTGLSRKQTQQLDLCMAMLKFTVVPEFSDKVTHIVTECDEKGQCTRTLKYLQGILAGKWILNFTWVELSLEYGKKMDEEAFEVPGTKNHPNSFGAKKGRENALKQLPPLFDGCTFYFYGNITRPWPQRNELASLCRSAGGKVLMREPRYDMKDEEASRVPYHMRHDSGEVRVNCFVVYSQEKSPRLNNLGDNVSYVHVTWLLDSISAFQLLPFDYKNLK